MSRPLPLPFLAGLLLLLPDERELLTFSMVLVSETKPGVVQWSLSHITACTVRDNEKANI